LEKQISHRNDIPTYFFIRRRGKWKNNIKVGLKNIDILISVGYLFLRLEGIAALSC
jgi:hypothetical protein